uniref:Putative aedine 6.5-8.5 protein family member n=1 Tax=Psorophora albipes TaxID=869069 RepID=T1D5R4_9DIPT
MKLLVILSVFAMIFGASLAAPQPQSNYIPGSLQWFCSDQPGSTGFGDWLKNVVKVWLPPAVCQTVVPSESNNSSASAIASLFD